MEKEDLNGGVRLEVRLAHERPYPSPGGGLDHFRELDLHRPGLHASRRAHHGQHPRARRFGQIEHHDAQRLAALNDLARLRQLTTPALMDLLGIRAPTYA